MGSYQNGNNKECNRREQQQQQPSRQQQQQPSRQQQQPSRQQQQPSRQQQQQQQQQFHPAHWPREVVQQQDGVWVHHCPRRQRGGEGRQRRVCAPLHDQGCAGAVPVPRAGRVRGVRAF